MVKVVEIINNIRNDPSSLLDLNFREFESIIAELLASFGWEVSLTPPTRDGGYDILGVSTDASGMQTSWVIECKRYSSNYKVGVEVLRSLLGVKTHFGIPNAIIVTTSEFTKDAKILSQSRSDLQIVDKEKVWKWITGYSLQKDSPSYTSSNSFSSCFISYSSKDEAFVQKLAAYLKQNGIKVWYAAEDMKPGEKIYNQIKSAISSFDRLLVVLSENSMESDWVKTELVNALDKQRTENRQVLFPISLTTFEKLKKWELIDANTGVDIARELRSYFIPDFSQWQDELTFQTVITKIINALKKDELEKSSTQISKLIQQFRGALYPGDKQKLAREIGEFKERAISAIPVLQKALKNPSGQVRDAAAWALGEIGTDEALKILADYENRV